MKELFLLTESCMTPQQSSQEERTPEKTAFELVVIGIFSPIQWFGEVRNDGLPIFRPYVYFDKPVQFRHVIGSMQAYFWRSLQARARATLRHAIDFETGVKAPRLHRFFDEDDGMAILVEQFVPKPYGHAIDPGELRFDQVFEPSCNLRLEVHNRLFHRDAELLRGISHSDEQARAAWLWLVNSTRDHVFELTDPYWGFEKFYSSQQEWAFS